MTRVLHRFRAHRKGVFVRYDDINHALTWRPDGAAGEVTEWLSDGVNTEWTTLSPGDRLRVQDGEIDRNSSNSRGGYRQMRHAQNGGRQWADIYVGRSCISAMAHPKPHVALLALRLMEHALGGAETARHLRDHATGASTLQTHAVIRVAGGHNLHLTMIRGVLRCSHMLTRTARVEGGILTMTGNMPEIVSEAALGRPLRDVCGHPAFADPRLTVSVARNVGDQMRFVPKDVVLPVAEAIKTLAVSATAVAA